MTNRVTMKKLKNWGVNSPPNEECKKFNLYSSEKGIENQYKIAKPIRGAAFHVFNKINLFNKFVIVGKKFKLKNSSHLYEIIERVSGFLYGSSAMNNSVCIAVIDDINRNDSKKIKEIRQNNILVLTEEEVLSILINKKRREK